MELIKDERNRVEWATIIPVRISAFYVITVSIGKRGRERGERAPNAVSAFVGRLEFPAYVR